VIVFTNNISAREWFDQTSGLFARVIPPMKLESEDKWKDWAVYARLFQPQIPDPFQFTDWKRWADRFNQVMYLVKQR
jgi:hypothetical protein